MQINKNIEALQANKAGFLNYNGFSELDLCINKIFWIIFAAVLSFIPTLFLPHIGEEGVYTITSQEMLVSKNYWQPLLYGGAYSRPPFYNWLIMAVTKILGPEHVLLSARIVTCLATVFMSALTGWVSFRLLKNKLLSVLSVALFLSGDLLLRRGWIAYSDPIFSLFTFMGMGILLLAVHENKYKWLLLANVSIFLAYLSKVHTTYVFYGLTGLVLLWQVPISRKFLLNKISVFIHAVTLFVTILWGMANSSGSMAITLLDTWHLLSIGSLQGYIQKVLFFPLQCVFLMLPISLFIVIKLILNKNFKQMFMNFYDNEAESLCGSTKVLLLVLFINLLPYWLSPRSHIRYLMPLYPFMAILMSYIIVKGDILGGSIVSNVNAAIKWLWLGIAIKLIISTAWYPYEQTVRKGNAQMVAAQVLEIVGKNSLYIQDSTSVGLRVAAEINKIRYPVLLKAALKGGKNDEFLNRGYVITGQVESEEANELISSFTLGKDRLYLYKTI